MIQKRKSISVQKYILAFCLVIIIFNLGFFISDYLNDKRFLEIDRAKKEFQIQVLAMETQIFHFKEILCSNIGDDILTHELHLIGEKIKFMVNSLSYNHSEILHLKKHYSLLQIKHYQFSQQLCKRCDLGLTHILYFFAHKKYCPYCEKQGVVLTYLARENPLLKIYSFDYKLDLPALNIVKPVIPSKYLDTKIEPREFPEVQYLQHLPIIVINDKPYFGFKDLQEMKELIGI